MDGGADDQGDADHDGAEEDGERHVLLMADLVPDVHLRRQQVEQRRSRSRRSQPDAGEDHRVEHVVPADGECGIHASLLYL